MGVLTNSIIERMRMDGYPFRIRGNGGYVAILYNLQPLLNGDYMAVYRYPRGECCHSLEEIKAYFDVVEQ